MSGHCLFCGGHVLETGACELCGIRRLAVAEKRIGARCPRCATEHLGPVGIGALVVQGCERCRGLFVATSEWDALLDLTEHASLPEEVVLRPTSPDATPAADAYRSPHLPPQIDVEPLVACPVCRARCERVEFAGISRVMVDVCARHGVWLDAGELAQVVARTRENPVFLEGDKNAELRGDPVDPSQPSLLAVLGSLVRHIR